MRGWVLALLAGLTVLAALLRARGLSGFAIHHWDEGLAWRGALWFASLGAEGHYSPTHAPPLVSLLLGGAARCLEVLGLARGPAAAVWVNVLAGTLLVPSAFALAREVTRETSGERRGSQAGLAAAALVACSPLHVDFSRSLLTDGVYALLLVSALALGCGALRSPSRARWLAAGVAVALLQATKYNGFLVLAPLGVARLARRPPGRSLLPDALALALPTVLVMGANVGALALLGRLDDFLAHYSGYVGQRPEARELLGTLAVLGLGGLPLALAALAACLSLLWRPRVATWVLLASLLLYLAFAARYTLYLRLLVPVATLALVALGAAVGRAGPRTALSLLALLLVLQGQALLRPPFPVREELDGHARAVESIERQTAGLPRLVCGQEHVWWGLSGEVVTAPPASPRALELLDRVEEVVLVYDLGAFSRLRDWNLDRLHGALGEAGVELQREESVPGLDCLQNNLGLEAMERLDSDPELRRRVLGVHWVRIESARLRELLSP